jgi:hypothetical protein
MSYYGAGDYYAAGGIFGTLGSIIGGVARTVGSVIPGPIGAVAGAIGGVLKPPPTPLRPMVSTQGGGGLSIPTTPVPGVTGALQRLVPGGATGYEVSLPTGGGMAGYHANKSGYWTQDGQYHPPGSVWVKNRRMNPGNASALRRGIRREKAFIALAKRALRGTGISVSRRSFATKRRRR